MRRPTILLMLLLICGCGDYQLIRSFPVIELGAPASEHVWVYLSGLLQDVQSERFGPQETLDQLGKQLNIKFLAVIPQHRCPDLGNKLCWPSNNKEETLQTYQYIKTAIGKQKIEGFIGFSNGGFFLHALAQYIELNKPIITIGAAGTVFNQGKKNRIYLLIGKEDRWHYDVAKKFYVDAQHSLLKIDLIEYEGGHVLPKSLLHTVIAEALGRGTRMQLQNIGIKEHDQMNEYRSR